ncbi:MAG TPA: DUF4184 family protein [Terriglobales bacterium]|nr:DUF4184 family protein [Terriglobales bacterium]
MPFTVSHAAAVLPLRRFNLVWSAFIVGSMAPDFPYIVGTEAYRDWGHHFPSLLWFTLPASLIALWFFHIIKRPIIELLPTGMQERLSAEGNFSFFPARRFFAILAATVLGIASHLLWDAFTHAHSWPWEHFAFMRIWVRVPVIDHRVPLFSVLQYLSSVVGMLALAVWVLLWYRAAPLRERQSSTTGTRSRVGLAVAMFGIAAIFGTIRAITLIGIPASLGRVDTFLFVCGVTSLAVAFWQLLLYCVLVSSYQVW